MLRHQFGQNLILRLDLPFQMGDAFLFGLMAGPSSPLKSRDSVLEELILPAVEHRRLEPQFVTEIRDWHSFHQVPPQNGDLLFRRVMLPLLVLMVAPLFLTDERFLHFQLRQDRNCSPHRSRFPARVVQRLRLKNTGKEAN